MIYIFDGEDRKKAEQKARMILGEKIEIIDADNIDRAELESIFLGVTFFEAERRILSSKLLPQPSRQWIAMRCFEFSI